jgi:hypothetical protein
MKTLLIILVFFSATVSGQDLFRPGSYRAGDRVKDAAGNIYEVKKTASNITTLREGPYFRLIQTAPPPPPPPVIVDTPKPAPVVVPVIIDSMKLFDSVVQIVTREKVRADTFERRARDLQLTLDKSTTFDLQGVEMIKVNDTLYIFRPIQPKPTTDTRLPTPTPEKLFAKRD